MQQMAKDDENAKEKPLEKMTVKELKEVALAIPEITGVHGMNKQDLISAIKKARGVEESPKKRSSRTTREIKQKIVAFKAQRKAALEANDARMATIYKRRISRLKKKSRKIA
jgi:hypothetical protein